MTRFAIVIPVKRLVQAKSRLSGFLGADARAALVLAMFEDVMQAATSAPGVADVIVVSDDRHIRVRARRCHAHVVGDTDMDGINGAVVQGATAALARGCDAIAIAPADVPQIASEHFARARRVLESAPVVLQRARRDGGTNLLALSPPDFLQPAFGQASFARHRALARARGVEPVELDDALGLDIDTPEDCHEFLRLGTTTRTQALLQSLGVGARSPRVDLTFTA